MANLKEIKNRIVSVGSTMQITNAMKLVSAAKLKKAQDAITEMRPYAKKLQELLKNLSGDLDGNAGGDFTKTRPVQKVLLVLVTSNRGLCGGFNSNIIKEAKRLLDSDLVGKEVELISIGKKGADAYKKAGFSVENLSQIIDDPKYTSVSKIGERVINDFKTEKYDQVLLVYNQFKNAATQLVQTEQLLPLELPKTTNSNATEYIFEPGRNEIVMDLIPKTIKTQLFKGVLDSIASEHGARMTAMHKATDNANDLKKELVLTYNQVRQAAITKEILEIVSGAEALDG